MARYGCAEAHCSYCHAHTSATCSASTHPTNSRAAQTRSSTRTTAAWSTCGRTSTRPTSTRSCLNWTVSRPVTWRRVSSCARTSNASRSDGISRISTRMHRFLFISIISALYDSFTFLHWQIAENLIKSHFLKIKNDYTDFCLDNLGRKSGEDVGASECHGQGFKLETKS